jgi:hypothetical protein
VLALDEPLRRVVLLRHVEGLNATEIGSREGLPPGTVRWRLKRALELLRDELDRDAEGDRRTWQLAMAPIVTAPGAAPAKAGLLAGAITMTTAKIVTVTAVTAAVVIAAVALGRDRGGTSAGEPPPAAPAQPVTAAADRAEPPAQPAEPLGPRRFASAEARARFEQEILRARDRREAAARSAAAAPASAPAAGTPPPNLTAKPDYGKEYIRERVRELIPLLSECYTMALERDPTLEGTIVVDMTLVGEPEVGGLVGTSEIDPDESTLLEAGFTECIRETMYALEIDPPPDGGTVRVRYPFQFRDE